MLVEKLTVPLINNEILKRASCCYIATATISESAFDFLIQRLPAKCLVKMVTGLHLPTSPQVLKDSLEKYADKISFKIYAENFFHPKVYIFELVNKTRVAFLGSGNFTMGGFTKNEELFYQITDLKEIGNLIEWFDEYFKASKKLTKSIIDRYEKIYPALKQRMMESERELKQFTDTITNSFNWDNIDFKNQYFQKEDYLVFENSKAHLDIPSVIKERIKVQNKLLDLHEDLKRKYTLKNNLHEHYNSNHIVSSLETIRHHEHKVKSMWLAYGRSWSELSRYSEDARHMDFIRLQVIIQQTNFGIWLMPGKENGGDADREYFRNEMKKKQYREQFYSLIKKLGDDYWIEVAEKTEDITEFDNAESLWSFTKNDSLNYYFIIGKDYEPGNKSISVNEISNTIITEFKKLYPLYRLMKDKSFE